MANQLRRVYPTRPDRADAWLGREIMRAARDPGALGVFRSVFYLPKPRALNYLVASRFAKPTLVLQARGRQPGTAGACRGCRPLRRAAVPLGAARQHAAVPAACQAHPS